MALAGTREWSSRRPALSADTPKQLADRVEQALDLADRLLFTVTPREELDLAAQWQRMADQAWCGQLRHVVASTARMSSGDRDFAGDELGLALGLSPGAGRALVWECGAIASLPGLVEAVESGRLGPRHVKTVMRVLGEVSLTLEQRQAVALIALARYVDQTPAAWAELVRRLVLTVDPQAARRRRDERADERRADFYPRADQQGALWLQAPVEAVAAAQARVTAEARRLKAAGDERTMNQLVCDVALALLTDGTLSGQPAAPFEVHVVTPLSVLEGGDAEVAEIPGWGPLLPSTARGLARQAGGFSQVVVDAEGHVIAVGDRVRASTLRDAAQPPDDGFLVQAVRAMRQPPVVREPGSSGYRPSPRLTRFLRARDRTCVFPGCRQPAQLTDIDHRVPWPRGRTTADNLQCLCRHHHRAKHAVFRVVLDPDGTVVWITRGGWLFRRRPSGC